MYYVAYKNPNLPDRWFWIQTAGSIMSGTDKREDALSFTKTDAENAAQRIRVVNLDWEVAIHSDEFNLQLFTPTGEHTNMACGVDLQLEKALGELWDGYIKMGLSPRELSHMIILKAHDLEHTTLTGWRETGKSP